MGWGLKPELNIHSGGEGVVHRAPARDFQKPLALGFGQVAGQLDVRLDEIGPTAVDGIFRG
jgi:hypothetical protein